MRDRTWNVGALVSVAVCAVLLLIGFVRFLSYSQGVVGEMVRGSALACLAYNPDSVVSTRLFKVLATPSVVAIIYFFFRWRNAGIPFYPATPVFYSAGRLDFESPLLRAILTSIVTLGWFVLEWFKFHVPGFYPDSPLEHPWINVAVLLAGQAVTFWAMKHLSFARLVTPASRPSRRPPADRARA